MEVVTALAATKVPVSVPVVAPASQAADKSEGERASKWARKKENMKQKIHCSRTYLIWVIDFQDILLTDWYIGPLKCIVPLRHAKYK